MGIETSPGFTTSASLRNVSERELGGDEVGIATYSDLRRLGEYGTLQNLPGFAEDVGLVVWSARRKAHIEIEAIKYPELRRSTRACLGGDPAITTDSRCRYSIRRAGDVGVVLRLEAEVI